MNAVLFRTGDQSRDFAVVLATNRPGDLDSAILDRMDEALEFGLPGVSERQQILSLYLDQYIFKAGTVEGGAGAASSRGLWQRFSVSYNPRAPPPGPCLCLPIKECLLARLSAGLAIVSTRGKLLLVSTALGPSACERDATCTHQE